MKIIENLFALMKINTVYLSGQTINNKQKFSKMNPLLQQFNNGTKLAYIGVTGWPELITSMEATKNHFSISCESGMSFVVSADKIHYANTL